MNRPSAVPPQSSVAQGDDPQSKRREEIKATLRKSRNKTPAERATETLSFLLDNGVTVEEALRLALRCESKPPKTPGGLRRVAPEVLRAVAQRAERELREAQHRQRLAAFALVLRPRCRAACNLRPSKQTPRRAANRGATRAGPKQNSQDPDPDAAPPSPRFRGWCR